MPPLKRLAPPNDLEEASSCAADGGGGGDDEGDNEDSVGRLLGRCCVWFLVNHIDIPLFFVSFLVLYLSANRCCYCVFMVAVVSALLCMRFRILNATLWSALLVLDMRKDWDLAFGTVRLSWNRVD